MHVAGSVAVVSGGASGLGQGTVRRLLADGARIGIIDLPSSQGAALAEELGGDVVFAPADVRSGADVEQAVAHIAETFGRVDVNVNAAGIATAQRVLARDGTPHSLDLFQATVEVNLIGAFNVLRWSVHHMANNEPGTDGERGLVVNVASIAGYEGQVGQAAYSASKGGIIGMTLPIARDLAPVGIRVMTIAPGIMDTPMMAGAPPELRERLLATHLFPNRFGTADDFARLVIHFMENTLLNGEVVRLDAGGRLPPK